jgi:transcriptional antiterminator RfaH
VAKECSWYSLKSQPKHEQLAAAYLRKHCGLDIFSPRVRFQRKSHLGKKWVTEPLFPGYLFACFNLEEQLIHVRYGQGVQGVVHFKHYYPRIPDSIIEDLREEIGEGELKEFDTVLEEGLAVELVEGPLSGFQGVVKQILPAKLRVKVLLDFLGQATVIEVQASQILPQQESPFRN